MSLTQRDGVTTIVHTFDTKLQVRGLHMPEGVAGARYRHV